MGLRRLAISNPAANTDTTLFTSDNQYLMSVIAANKSTTTAANIRVWVEPSGSSSPSQYAYIVYDIPVDETNSYETFRFAVNQNDVIKVRANTSDISFQSYGLVQFDVNLGVGISSYQNAAPLNPVDGMIWIDADAAGTGGKKPAYVWSSAASAWVEFVGGIDTSANLTWSGTNIFTGTVTIPGYEKEIPLQSSAPSSPSSSDLWVDSTDPIKPILKVYNGTSWIVAGSAIEADEDQIVLSARMFMQ